MKTQDWISNEQRALYLLLFLAWLAAYVFCVFAVFCESFNQFVGHYGGEAFGVIALLAEAFLIGLFRNPQKDKKDTAESEADNVTDDSEESTPIKGTKPNIFLIIFLAEFLLFSVALLYGNIAQLIH